jgi:hypothetical protein
MIKKKHTIKKNRDKVVPIYFYQRQNEYICLLLNFECLIIIILASTLFENISFNFGASILWVVRGNDNIVDRRWVAQIGLKESTECSCMGQILWIFGVF